MPDDPLDLFANLEPCEAEPTFANKWDEYRYWAEQEARITYLTGPARGGLEAELWMPVADCILKEAQNDGYLDDKTFHDAWFQHFGNLQMDIVN